MFKAFYRLFYAYIMVSKRSHYAFNISKRYDIFENLVGVAQTLDPPFDFEVYLSVSQSILQLESSPFLFE